MVSRFIIVGADICDVSVIGIVDGAAVVAGLFTIGGLPIAFTRDSSGLAISMTDIFRSSETSRRQ